MIKPRDDILEIVCSPLCFILVCPCVIASIGMQLRYDSHYNKTEHSFHHYPLAITIPIRRASSYDPNLILYEVMF